MECAHPYRSPLSAADPGAVINLYGIFRARVRTKIGTETCISIDSETGSELGNETRIDIDNRTSSQSKLTENSADKDDEGIHSLSMKAKLESHLNNKKYC
ncbi:hypothetical protein EVAR_23189_1 [Eumeta japonica]|uniref:Uncharacterized protein n=1 Tax=Eumeta variegata TaxID=151549 RepID=A0A4C1VF50_EUMVA|nr:hypothetical protein EVAR_23189_1 [Eumeta japonica]